MDINPEFWRRRENGTVDVTEIPRNDWPPSESNRLVKSKFLYRWQPPYQLLQHLPDWFELCLVCDLWKDGSRRFSPVGKALVDTLPRSHGLNYVAEIRGLSLVASLGGNVILDDRGEIEEGLPFSYDEARLFLQYVRHLREYLGDTVKLGHVLNVCAGGRVTRDKKDILPEDLGLDGEGNGVPWGIGELKREGLRGAVNAGIESPNAHQILRYGLLHAAMRKPIKVKEGEAGNLVRMSLFGLDSASAKAAADDLHYVAVQAKRSLADHLHDTSEEFDKWLKDPKSNLIHRIAKRKDCQLDRKQVRRLMVELGWRALQILGRCVDKQMRTFRDAFPEPLTKAESVHFEPIFLGHSAFGDLPFLLLYDRFDFLKEAIIRAWNRPHDERAIAIVHRMMFYYAELVGSRRESDRLYKQRTKLEAVTSHVTREEGIKGDVADSRIGRVPDEFKEAAFRLAVARGADVGGGDEEWDARLLDGEEDGNVVFNVSCAQRGVDQTYYVPFAEFASAVREVMEEDGSEQDS